MNFYEVKKLLDISLRILELAQKDYEGPGQKELDKAVEATEKAYIKFAGTNL